MLKKSKLPILLRNYTFAYFFCVILITAVRIFQNGLYVDDFIRTAACCVLLYFPVFFAVLLVRRSKMSLAAGRKGRKAHKHSFWGSFLKKLLLILPVFLLAGALLVYRAHLNVSDILPAPTGLAGKLQEFGERYPEAKDYVDHYEQYKDKDFDMDISSELSEGTIPLFIQWDKRWGYKSYGNNLIGMTGCGPTCLSMVLCGLTQNAEYTPYYVAKYSEEKGYYQSGEGTSWNLMTEGAWDLGLDACYGYVREDYIREHLSVDTPMICSMYPGDFTYGGHFIVLTGFDEEGRILVNDPNSPEKSAIPWEMERILPQIRSLWVFSRIQ